MRAIHRAAIGLLLAASGAVHAADGNELFALGALQKGLGGAGVAHALDSSWLLLNPAALTELEERADLQFELLHMGATLKTRGLPFVAFAAPGEMEDSNLIPVPSGSYMRPLGRGVLALGGFGTQGNRLEFPRPRSGLAFLANGDRRSVYQIARFPLVYARPLGRGWSAGAGVIGVAGRFRTDTLTIRLAAAEADNAWDSEEGIGFIFGIHKQTGRLRLGLAYESEVWMGGYERYDQDIFFSPFNLPPSLQAGLAFELTPRLEIMADWKWTGWSHVPQIGNASVRGGLGWRDQRLVKAGLNFKATPRWTLRAGVSTGNSPMEADDVFVNALTPGLAQTHVALGASWRFKKRHELHIALSHAVRASAIENGRGDIFSIAGFGTKVSYREDSITLGYTLHF